MNNQQNTHDEDVMVRYLLGELSEEERVQFEESCFADDQHFEELLAVEAELTDDYVRRDLVGLRRERFENQLLNTPETRYDLEFARMITEPTASAPQATAPVIVRRKPAFAWLDFHSRALQASVAALALVLMGLGIWLFWSLRETRLPWEQAVRNGARTNVKPQDSPKPPNQSPPPQPSPGEQQAVATPEGPPQRDPRNGTPTPGPDAPAIVSILVVPGFDRSAGGANDLIIPPQARAVRLQLALEGNNYRSYRAVLRSVEGREIFNRPGLKARSTSSGSAVTLELAVSAFPEGDFILALTGTTSQGEEEVHKYFLSVDKE